MSDEASGPEDEDESLTDWKLRMAVKNGIPADITEDALDRLEFREVIKPEWRSAEVRQMVICYPLDDYMLTYLKFSSLKSLRNWTKSGRKIPQRKIR